MQFLIFPVLLGLLSVSYSAHAQSAKDQYLAGDYLASLQALDSDNSLAPGEAQHLRALSVMKLSEPKDYFGRELSEDQLVIEVTTALQAAVQAGYIPAKLDLATVLIGDDEQLTGVPLSLVQEAAAEGYEPAQFTLQFTYCANADLPTSGFDTDAELARLYALETDADDAPNFITGFGNLDDDQLVTGALSRLALSFATGACGRRDEALARKTLIETFNKPHGSAAVEAAIDDIWYLFTGASVADETRYPVEINMEKALDWVELGFDLGLRDSTDLKNLFKAYSLNESVPANPNKSDKFLKAFIAIASLPESERGFLWEWDLLEIWSIATDILDTNYGHSAHKPRMLEIAERAMVFVAQEDEEAEFRFSRLARFYEEGKFGKPDTEEAVKWLERLAQNGDGNAQFRLAWILSDQSTNPVDGESAVYWYARAFESTASSAAAYNIGLIYHKGEIVKANPRNSLYWFERAANAGNIEAMFEVGFAYDLGKGTPENDAKAYEWYRKAAELGHGASQRNSGIMLMTGEGTGINKVEAYKWLNLAASRGIENASNLKASLESRMTRAEINSAQRLSAAWRPKQSLDKIGAPPAADGTAQPTNDTSLVSIVQEGLGALGYYSGEVDGLYGPRTKRAIEDFQRDFEFEVDGRPTSDLAFAVGAAVGISISMEEGENPKLERTSSSGSGFFVSAEGYLITNAHVVSDCKTISVADVGDAVIVDVDVVSDLAILRTDGQSRAPLKLRTGRGIRLGDDLVVAGFPLSNILGNEIRITSGDVSALSGFGGDRRMFQISAPIQPGNSGGPILDSYGNVVGVVVSKLNAIAVASEMGDIPQNINFGVSLGTLQSFLDQSSVDYEMATGSRNLSKSKIAEIAQASTVQVLCSQ